MTVATGIVAAIAVEQILVVLVSVCMLAASVLVTMYRQARIKRDAIQLPYVDPMPSLEVFLDRWRAADRPLRSYLTPKRAFRVLHLVPLIVASPFLATMITHPAVGLIYSTAILFQLAVFVYQSVAVDLGLMRAVWAGWLHRTRPPVPSRPAQPHDDDGQSSKAGDPGGPVRRVK